MIHSTRFEVIEGSEVTHEQLAQCALLYSEHYGIWAEDAPSPLRPMGRVKMTPKRLGNELLSNPDDTLLVMAFKDQRHVGHAFITRWECQGDSVAWVTQLVVHATYRRRYIATGMLSSIKGTKWFESIGIIGIASSNAASCNTLAKLVHLRTTQINLSFVRDHAAAILAQSPIPYLRKAPLRGELFGEACIDGAISLVDTGFHLDHQEPRKVLDEYRAENKWTLGTLRAGHEFVVVVPVPAAERVCDDNPTA